MFNVVQKQNTRESKIADTDNREDGHDDASHDADDNRQDGHDDAGTAQEKTEISPEISSKTQTSTADDDDDDDDDGAGTAVDADDDDDDDDDGNTVGPEL